MSRGDHNGANVFDRFNSDACQDGDGEDGDPDGQDGDDDGCIMRMQMVEEMK